MKIRRHRCAPPVVPTAGTGHRAAAFVGIIHTIAGIKDCGRLAALLWSLCSRIGRNACGCVRLVSHAIGNACPWSNAQTPVIVISLAILGVCPHRGRKHSHRIILGYYPRNILGAPLESPQLTVGKSATPVGKSATHRWKVRNFFWRLPFHLPQVSLNIPQVWRF